MEGISIDAIKANGKSANDLTKTTNATRQIEILAYLKKHNDKAFSQKQIAEALKVSEQQINQTCKRLLKNGEIYRYELNNPQPNEPRFYWSANKIKA